MTERERIEAELERDKKRWTVRRRITLSATFSNFAIILFYMLSAFILRPDQVEMLREFNSIAITIVGGNFSVILAYFGLNTYETSYK